MTLSWFLIETWTNVDLLIHDPVAEPHEFDRKVFASTSVAALPC